MGRRRKRRKNKDEEDDEEEKSPLIQGDAKRSVAAVFLFTLSVLVVLGFLERAGILGHYLNAAAGLLLGWGKWLLPLVLVIAGIILLFRKETLFYVTKLVGLAVSFLSILGFFHIYLDPEKMAEIAKSGAGGGYAGYVIAFVLSKITGTVGGTVILVALFLVGIIIAFNFSIVGLARRFLTVRKEEGVAEQEEVEKPEEEEEKPEVEPESKFVQDPEPEEEGEEVEDNISQPTFSTKQLPWFSQGKKLKEEFSVEIQSSGKKWRFPSLDLLESATGKAQGGDVEKNARIIRDTLSHFGIEVELGGAETGPTVTQYSFRPAVGVKLSKITALSNDLALALAAHPIRIEAPIPGKSLIGIEVPNKAFVLVRLKELLQSEQFRIRQSNLMISLGEDVSGNYYLADLRKMPHLLIAGSTGSGKSICINSILLSLLYQNSPDDLKFILVDPKRVELTLYDGIPHLLADVIVDSNKVLSAFKWAINEMERRYRLFQETASRDVASYNQKLKNGEKKRTTDPETGEIQEEKMEHLPYIVIVIDELADLMASHGKEVEGAIIRLAQMARAVGIHMIVSTQRPSVEVLTGLIKANITTRIAFKVATQVDSRTILDTSGADKLLGNGDLLLLSSQSAKLKRLQGVFVSEAEVKRVVKFIKSQKWEVKEEDLGNEVGNGINGKLGLVEIETDAQYEDSLYGEAKRVVVEAGKASSSLLQRRLRIGYARAARLIDMLEEQGVIGPGAGAKPREILAKREDSDEETDNEITQEERDKWQM